MQTFKKVITIFLLAAMLCSLMPAGAIAEEYKESEEESSSLTGEISDSEEESATDPENAEEAPEAAEDEESGEEADSETAESDGTAVENTAEINSVKSAALFGAENSEVQNSNYVAYIDYQSASNPGAGYESLSAAISAANSGETITLVADCTVTSSITINTKNITITDDGKSRCIYFSCTEKSGGDYPGKGIVVCGGKTLNITSSENGGITLIGHSNDDDPTYNYSYLVYAYTVSGGGTVNMDGVTVKDCRVSSGGALGTYKYSNRTYGSMCLSGCHIYDNISLGTSGGAAVYNAGSLHIQSGTEIYNNRSSSSKSGAVFCAEGDSSKSGGTITISGTVKVSGNMKNCSKGSSVPVYSDGDASDIYVASSSSIICLRTAAGSIGFDYAGDDNTHRFAVYSEKPSSTDNLPFFSNQDSSKCARYDADNTAAYWADVYSFDAGSAQGGGLSYSYSSAALTSYSDTFAASVLVDSGSFTVNTSALPNSISGYGICGGALVTLSSADDFQTDGTDKAFTALTLTGLTETDAQSFIWGIVFAPRAYGVKQNVTFGFETSVDSDSYLFGDKVYRFVSTAGTRYAAYSAAVEAGEQLVCITDETINDVVKGLSEGTACWTGGALVSDQWYFPDGTRYSASAVSSEGYNGCFTAWGKNEPVSDGIYMYAEEGKWYAVADSGNGYGYMLESSALCSKTVSNTVSNTNLKTRLNSYSLELGEGEIAVNYFFTFSQAFINDATGKGSYVEIKIGNEKAVPYYVSDIIKNKAEHNSDAYKLTVPVAPKYMNAETVIKFYWGDGTLLGYYGGEGKTNYNVRQYALTVIEKQSTGDAYNSGFSQALVDLVKAMLNYGAAAEKQFIGTATVISEGDSIADTSDAMSADKISGGYFENSNSNVSYALSLYASSETVMRIEPSGLSDGFTVTVDGSDATVTDGYIDIPVAMQDLGHIHTVVFYDGDNSIATLQINVICVIKALLETSSTPDAAKLTADRLYKMGLAADEYFGTYVPSASATQAVLNTAYAYLAKAEYTQYDQKKMVDEDDTDSPNIRRQLDVSPEDATESSSIYMDCSSFVYNVYREVFGEKAVQEAFGLTEAEMNTYNMMYAVDTSGTRCTVNIRINYSNYDCSKLSFNKLYSMLQPGDLIVKYRSSDSHGHVVLWTGDGYIHCTGSSYDYNSGEDNTEASGAVRYVPLSKFNESFYDGFDYLTVLRPLQELTDEDIISSGTARQQLGGLSVSKTASVNGSVLYPGNGVNPNDEITYTITISNPVLTGALNTARTVDIEDTLPKGLELKTGSLTANNVTVDVGETATIETATIEIEYKATVKAEAGTVISASTGSCCSSEAGADAGKIVFSGIEISVEASSDDIISNIVSNANDCVETTSMSKTANTFYDVLNGIYSNENALGSSSFPELSSTYVYLSDLDQAEYNSSNWVTGIFKKTDSGNYYVTLSDSSWSESLVSNFASGRKVLNSSDCDGRFDTDTRVRNLTSNNLMPGDLLCVYTPSLNIQYSYYIYTGNGKMVSFVPGNVCEEVTADSILGKLPIKTCWAVFRFAGRF